ncbi:MAG: TolC family protein [Thermodesulfovibrionales bacterium]
MPSRLFFTGNGERAWHCAMPFAVFVLLASVLALLFAVPVRASGELHSELFLNQLLNEALKNNHEIIAAEARLAAAGYKIPQATSLPDPMFMFGYQNEGWKRYTYGEMQGAQWMFSASQMFPYPGKLPLKGQMASKESEGLEAAYQGLKRKTVERVKEIYFDLFLYYKNIDLIQDRKLLFSRIEDAALARYSSGMGLQQEVLMAQTEKYMLLEKEEMFRQKIQSSEAMLNLALGRDVTVVMGRPADQEGTDMHEPMEDLLNIHVNRAPFVQEKEKMVAAAALKIRMAEKEYYPDFTINAGYFKRAREFEDMWSLTTTINLPIFYRTKQRQAVLEAKALLAEAEHEVLAMRSMLSSTIRDNYSMMKSAERLMALYKDGLIPKTRQDFDAALAGYTSGKTEAITIISRLKALIDVESLYWGQFVEREKAIARLATVTGAKGMIP